MSDRLRTFFALDLDATARAALADLGRAMSQEPGGAVWRWLPPENLHLTLRFLGQVDEAVLARLAEAWASRLAARPAFAFDVRGLGAFPKERRARVLWAGVDDPSGALAALAGEAEAVARAVGLPAEEREFSAHVTLARTRGEATADAAPLLARHPSPAFGRVVARAVTLYESHTGGEASRYVARARFALGPEGLRKGETDAQREERS